MIQGNSVQRKVGQVFASVQLRRSAAAVSNAAGKYSSAYSSQTLRVVFVKPKSRCVM